MNSRQHSAEDDDYETLNLQDFETISKQSSFYSGDWSSLAKHLCVQQYDVILASEVLYAPVNYGSLMEVFDKLLRPGGTCYIATKSYYFGCHGGGGTVAFLQALQEKYPHIQSKMIWQCPGGHDSAVTREIIQLTK